MEIVLIVAIAENGVIGRDNALPWRIKSDLQYFKAVTMGKPVVMGRKTYLSIGKPLKGRTNIVVSRDPLPLEVRLAVHHAGGEQRKDIADAAGRQVRGRAQAADDHDGPIAEDHPVPAAALRPDFRIRVGTLVRSSLRILISSIRRQTIARSTKNWRRRSRLSSSLPTRR
jgi:hypothetical protein